MPEENNSQSPKTNPVSNPKGSIDGIRPGNIHPTSEPISPLIENRPFPTNENTQDIQSVSKESKQKTNKKKNTLVIVFAVIIFLALSGVATAIYLKKNDTSSSNAPARNVNSLTEAAGSNSVDQTINDIDSLSNDEDTSGEGLSDSNLGL